MKIAILADIHGNMSALSAVLTQAQNDGVSSYIVAGDLIGYYYDTHKVLQALTDLPCVYCRGNHENIYAEWRQSDAIGREDIRKKYGSSYRMTEEHLTSDQKDFLLSLPHPFAFQQDNIRFLVSHGAPWDIDERIYPDAPEEMLSYFDEYQDEADVIITAHTHYPASWQRGNMLIVNPGSVGQPRDRVVSPSGARAQWGIYDTHARHYFPRISLYDPHSVLSDCDQYDPDIPYLKNILLPPVTDQKI
ncbi:MAG: metallophosphoesterase family protein [Alphaproteobacteria bacterium]|nr:metallophosphoesterase family protein [Alphaproteobacteria bacterium]